MICSRLLLISTRFVGFRSPWSYRGYPYNGLVCRPVKRSNRPRRPAVTREIDSVDSGIRIPARAPPTKNQDSPGGFWSEPDGGLGETTNKRLEEARRGSRSENRRHGIREHTCDVCRHCLDSGRTCARSSRRHAHGSHGRPAPRDSIDRRRVLAEGRPSNSCTRIHGGEAGRLGLSLARMELSSVSAKSGLDSCHP
jgi:hypothetical protein